MKNILKTIKLLRENKEDKQMERYAMFMGQIFSIVRSSVLPKLISMNFNEIPIEFLEGFFLG